MPQKPNVILIGIDTLRADHLGFAGYNRETSPNIDNLAAQSIVFENCFAQAPNTAPSFMSIMTSLYPTYHGITDIMNPLSGQGYRSYTLDPKIKTLAQVLKQNGYHTAAFTDGANLYNKIGFGRGFDYYDMNLKVYEHKSTPHTNPIQKSEIFYWLREFHKEPFFLFFHTFAVHNPWSAPQKYAALFGAAEEVGSLLKYISEQGRMALATELSLYNLVASELEKGNNTKLQLYQNLYDGAIKYVDDFLGELFALLENFQIIENSLIIFTADHGEGLLDHGALGHRQLYNEILHAPLIIKIPGGGRQRVVNQIVRLIDIMPTMLDALGIKTESLMQGVSLVPALNQNLDLTAIAENEIFGYAAQNKNYKYIYPRHNKFAKRVDEVYDLKNDPREKQNIALSNLDVTKKMFLEYEKELHKNNPGPPARGLLHILKKDVYWPE